ncbi:FG-GAP-like repeat-containing protein [Stieleria tagensis]|uniref:FG-GAP-like repeat-containing protein n=1 Tax=Stieleria tagensis TaxID=2956795 RepID=UPI00209BAB2F|nr:FG-GAP-like repeat-containing protein [Stieleria tagensis]
MQRRLSLSLILLITIVTGCSGDPSSVDVAARQSPADDTETLTRDGLPIQRNNPEQLTAAARAKAAAGDRHEAARLLAKAAVAAKFHPTSRVELATRALLDLGDVYPAIDLLSAAVDAERENDKLRRILFGLLGEAGRTDLMPEHYEALIRNRAFDLAVLLASTDTSQRLFPAETIERLIKRNPDDYRLRLGVAQSLRDDRRFADAESILREIIRHHPNFAPAHALLGRMPSVQQATPPEYTAWLNSAAPHCREQADFWISLADRHFRSADFATALSCYLAASQINPNRVIPWTQISQSIRQLRSAADGEFALTNQDAERIIDSCDRRAHLLLDLRMHLQRFGGSVEQSQHAACDIARTLNQMGRYWEAEAWSAIATTLPEDKDPALAELRQTITANLKRTRKWSSLPDLSPLDSYSQQAITDTNPSEPRDRSSNQRSFAGNASELRWADETQTRNLTVPAVHYPDIASALIHSMGSGGGTLDFDMDGWSDLILPSVASQSGETSSATNTLLRNLNGTFSDITHHAECGATGFGQGIAIGDYNEDGFPDIFFANIGDNRLFRNNGDGTFCDDTRSLGTMANQWTTCGAFADMDRDGITDLIAVNYCDLDSPVDEPCRAADGPAPCHPAKFPADSDQLLLGNGKGQFNEPFADEITQLSAGRGLGILAGNLPGHNQAAFVANDMSANHLLEITGPGLSELAVPLGIAVDGQSLAQASMGIAYGDFDGDLDLDLYVTGFAREYNIYYEQTMPGLWVDNTAVQGLIDSTLMTVGFGTQAIDMDADGIDELAITNGHIADFGPDHPPLAQPFQLMRRSQQATFTPVDMPHENTYLATNHIGRALWKIDVDRDLADDLVVTHQNAAPVLLANRTQTANRRIGVKLIGTNGSRDAIGATLTFVADGRQRVIWLMSGDGYMCSNERILKAGIGSSELAEEVTVAWPHGATETFGSLRAGNTYLLVEGSGQAFATE